MSARPIVLAFVLLTSACSQPANITHINNGQSPSHAEPFVVKDEKEFEALLAECHTDKVAFLSKHRGKVWEFEATVLSIADQSSVSVKAFWMEGFLVTMTNESVAKIKPGKQYRIKATLWSFDASDVSLVAFIDGEVIEEVKP